MRLNKLANAICRGLWLLEPRSASTLMPMAIKIMNREDAEFFDENDAEYPSLYHPQKGAWSFSDDEEGAIEPIQAGSILIIPINGCIMKDDYCGEPGTDTMSCWLRCALEKPEIVGIVLKINSGGGSVAGTGEFADLVKAATKPVIAYTDGMMASAAYWIGCSADEIFASHKTVEIGSIGTAICFYDNRKAMEEMGYKEIYINSDTSPDKNQDYFRALDGDESGIKDNVLNPTNDIFMSAVKSNRAGKLNVINKIVEGSGLSLNEPLTGKMYLSESAIAIGLIDKIGSLQDAIERCLEIAEIEIAA